jgi:pilus assembly protein CpaE
MSVRVLIADYDRVMRSEIREMVASVPDCEVVGLARDGQEAIQMAMQLAPHVAVIAYDLPGLSGPKTSETLSVLTPDLMTILFSGSKSTDQIEAAMRSGARALVAKPLDAKQLSSLIAELAGMRSRRESPEILQWADPTLFPKIISVTGAKGGVGKSTIAVNLSVVLAESFPDLVVLVDFYTQFGDIPTMMNIVPKGTIVDVMPVCKELDVDLVGNYITKHSSSVHVLVTSMEPRPPDVVSVECMDNLFYILKHTYRYIIVDMPPMLHASTLHVLNNSTLILLVASLSDLTTITDTKRFYDALRNQHISKESIGIVLNRVMKSNKLKTTDIEDMFDHRVLVHIENDDRVTIAANQGVPLAMTDRNSPFTRGVRNLADVLTVPVRPR